MNGLTDPEAEIDDILASGDLPLIGVNGRPKERHSAREVDHNM